LSPHTSKKRNFKNEKAGYTDWSSLGAENIYAYATSVAYAHAGFVVDWGGGPPDGMQNPRDHRNNMMSTQVREVGLSVTPHPKPGPYSSDVGPLVITEDFGSRWTQTQPYLLGTVYSDANGDDAYNDGEGFSGVTVSAEGPAGTFMTTTWASGGYQMSLPPGTYTVHFSHTDTYPYIYGEISRVTIGRDNVLLDGSFAFDQSSYSEGSGVTIGRDNVLLEPPHGGSVNKGSTSLSRFTALSPVDTAAGFWYSYDFDNDGAFEITDSPPASAVVQASYLAVGPGTRTIRAPIKDKDGDSTPYTTVILINSVPPTVNVGPDATITQGDSQGHRILNWGKSGWLMSGNWWDA